MTLDQLKGIIRDLAGKAEHDAWKYGDEQVITALWEIALQLAKIAESMPERSGVNV